MLAVTTSAASRQRQVANSFFNVVQLRTVLGVNPIVATGRTAPVVLMVDDAHTLTNASLRYIWLTSNLLSFSGVKLQLVLVGQPDLDLVLSRPEFAQLRLVAGAMQLLPALNDNEAMAYLDHKLRVAGGSLRQVMSASAVEALLQQSGGLPGEIDLIAGRALASGPQLGRRISRRAIMAALGDAEIQKSGPVARPVKVLAGAAGGLAVAALAVFLFMPRQPALLAPALPTLLQPQVATAGIKAIQDPDPAAHADALKEAASTSAAPGTVTETISVTPEPPQAVQPKPTPPEAEPFPVRTVQRTNMASQAPDPAALAAALKEAAATSTPEVVTETISVTPEPPQAVQLKPTLPKAEPLPVRTVQRTNMASSAKPRPPSFTAALPSAGKGLVLLAKAGDSSWPVNAPRKWALKTPHFVAWPSMLLPFVGGECGGSGWGTGHDHGTASARAEPHRHRPPAGYRPQDGAPLHRPRP